MGYWLPDPKYCRMTFVQAILQGEKDCLVTDDVRICARIRDWLPEFAPKNVWFQVRDDPALIKQTTCASARALETGCRSSLRRTSGSKSATTQRSSSTSRTRRWTSSAGPTASSSGAFSTPSVLSGSLRTLTAVKPNGTRCTSPSAWIRSRSSSPLPGARS